MSENKGWMDFVSEAERINYTIRNSDKMRRLREHWDKTDGVKRADKEAISA